MQIEAQKIEKAYKEFKTALNVKEKEVITKYYGFDKEVRHTLAEIGEMYGVTRERVRQIKVEALTKIKIIKQKAK